MNGGTCYDMINSFKCNCPIGFTGSRCQTNIDECDPNPCMNRGICVDAIAGFTCECPPGYTGKISLIILFLMQQNLTILQFSINQVHRVKLILTIVFQTLVIVVFVLTVKTRSLVNVTQVILDVFAKHKSTNVNRILAIITVLVMI
jgi:hypothetical protein